MEVIDGRLAVCLECGGNDIRISIADQTVAGKVIIGNTSKTALILLIKELSE